MTTNEHERRRSNTHAVYEFFRAHRNQWIDVHHLAQVGGFAAWRTRVSDARTLAEADGDEILWNRNVRSSAYMLRTRRIGRSADERIAQRSLFG